MSLHRCVHVAKHQGRGCLVSGVCAALHMGRCIHCAWLGPCLERPTHLHRAGHGPKGGHCAVNVRHTDLQGREGQKEGVSSLKPVQRTKSHGWRASVIGLSEGQEH